jgi:RimJ/RimL family protein N-acetyltransferase|tara:strand:- start:479 stop:994 length:516 start_codon:yes stop_codon:yes gene_type:complete
MLVKGEGFVIRSFKRSDEASIYKHINNTKIAQYTLRIPSPYTRKDATEFVSKVLKQQKMERPLHLNFGIDVGGKIVGGIGLADITATQAEIGYWLGEEYWGKGIMTGVVKKIVAYARKEVGLKKLFAYILEPNTASGRVLEKAGFTNHGIAKQRKRKDNRVYRLIWYDIEL